MDTTRIKKEIENIKHGVNLKEIERLQRIIKKCCKYIDEIHDCDVCYNVMTTHRKA